ncbi:MAG: VCBS repeat-containing protein, partial [Bacteroidetes bacterium]|nr:VCBS repeat-containing protein [Bacteroidota bacterium]
MITQIVFAQIRNDSIPVMENGKLLKNAWAGGLNSCQFSPVDINNDGIKDLYVIDNSSNKVSTFINGGTTDSVDYTYADEYRNAFPAANEWVRLIDFDGDGINDFFKGEGNKIHVYKGSYSNNIIQFTLYADNLLNTSTGTPIYVGSLDIPDVIDVNKDGDLDILSFDQLLSQVNYYENQSMELYGHQDSLIFTLIKSCWGYFNEDFTHNGVELGICPKSLNHSGGNSSLLALDMDGDNDLELLVGDHLFRNMVLLTNTTLGIEADFTLQDTAFPSNTTPVDLAYFPTASYLDIDNDNVNELIVSTNVEFYGENKESIIYYENTGL